MKREQILARMGLRLPENTRLRVVVCSDVANEADDPFAVLHHLLTPNFDVRGVIAAHFESKAPGTRTTMEASYQALLRLLRAAEIDDVPALHGCPAPLQSRGDAPDSEGVRFLIEEALRDDPRPLYVTALGALTDVAAALNRCPAIAPKLTVVWIGGGAYPAGGREFNLVQDIAAARTVFAAPCRLWQIPVNAYSMMEVTLPELAWRVRPCGAAGAYLYRQLEEYNPRECGPGSPFRKGENWCLGDQPAVGVLLQCDWRGNWHTAKAPAIADDMRYLPNPAGKDIRVYDAVDPRFILEDFYAKLALCCPRGV